MAEFTPEQLAIIQDIYNDQLGRAADTGGLNYYAEQLASGRSPADIEAEINRSLEGQQYDTQAVESAYRQMFGRTADDPGQQYWLSVAQSNIDAENQALLDYIRGGAKGTDVTALTSNPQGFTNLQLADLVADPYGGRMPTTSIYDVDAARGTNISYINGTPVQFVATQLGTPITTNYNQGQFTIGQGQDVLNNAALNASINRALASGAMSRDEYTQLVADVKAARSMEDVYTALNKPQATITLDAKYGLQTGQGNTLAEAQTRAADMQKVIDTFTSEYMPSNWSVASKAAEMNVPYAFGPSAYQGYSTMMTPEDVVTDANFQQKQQELAKGIASLRPQYRSYDFNRTAPEEAIVPQTFANRALLGERAPGGVDLASVAQAAPATFGGVAALPARPAANVSTPEGMAEPTVEAIMANQIAEATPAVGMRKGGIASLARHGRHGDTMLAHITPEEARMLKAHGGSGTINPVTGLPEFFKIPGLYQLEKATRPITRPVRKLVEPILPFVKYIAPFIPGIGMPLAVGLGALASGMEGGHGFNLKKGIMGGITAYGMSNVAAGLGNAGAVSGTETAATGFGNAAATPSVDAGVQSMASASGNTVATTAPGASSSLVPADVTNLGGANVAPEPSMFSKMVDYKPEGGFSLSDYGRGIQNVSGLGVDQATTDAARTAFTNKAGTGTAAAVIGAGSMDAALAEQDKLKEQQQLIIDEKERKRKAAADRAYAAMSATPWMFAEGGAIDDEAGVDGMAAGGSPIVAKYSGEDGSDVELPEYLRRTPDFEDATAGLSRLRPNFRAMPAGDRAVAGRAGLDYDVDKDTGISAGLGGMAMKTPKGITGRLTQADLELRRKLGAGQMHAGIARDLMGGKNRFNAGYTMNFEAGGQPRFLSGGGDGMSDSIPANIDGKQEARLADGEFVIPADVVSHLGNGSSKAGAKRLYSMMDRVREARTGNPKQGKEINANKYLLA